MHNDVVFEWVPESHVNPNLLINCPLSSLIVLSDRSYNEIEMKIVVLMSVNFRFCIKWHLQTIRFLISFHISAETAKSIFQKFDFDSLPSLSICFSWN